MGGRMVGVYVGVVADNTDPMNSGRAKVQVPAAGITATWAPVCTSGAGRPLIPVGSRVVVAFEGGDPSRPIVLGKI